VTTFIVCAVLFWLGSSIAESAPVQGFALTLFIGVAVSMFTAIVVTRTLLRLFVGSRLAKRTALFSAHREKKLVLTYFRGNYPDWHYRPARLRA